MASHSQDPYSPIHFYIRILKANLGTIMIPSKFTVRYGRCLTNPVCLKSPDGKEWRVYWAKRGNDFWFQKGWKEFTNFYSLVEGYFVLFKYEGTSLLGVHIIDKSALEIDYPLPIDGSSQEDNLNLDNLSDDGIEILDEMPPSPNVIEILDEMPLSPKASQNTHVSYSRPHKKMRRATDADIEMRSFNLKNMPMGMKTKGGQFQGTKLKKPTNADLKFCKQKSVGTRIFNKSKCLSSEHRKTNVLTAVEKNKALGSASSFKSDNPYFTMVMHPSYVSSNWYLPMPKEFAEKHMKEECGVVQLHTLDEGIWHAKYKFPKIGEGWRKFVLENGLKVGHVCVFELIDHSFKVHIFRDGEKVAGNLKVNSFEKERSSSMQDPSLEKASSSKPENPQFVVMMTHSHIHGTSYMNVPMDFAKAHLRNSSGSVTLTVQDKDWTVGFAFRSYNKQRGASFSWGWKQFCKDNDLKVDDICEFELTQKFKFQVTVFRPPPNAQFLQATR